MKLRKKIVYLILLIWAILVLFPIYWMFTTSLSMQTGVISKSFIPKSVTLNNFIELFTIAPVARWLLNTILVAVVTTVIALLFDSLAGYVFGIIKPKGHNFLFALILACMMVPDQTRLVPVYTMVTNLGWYDTFKALIIPFMGSAYGVFLMRQYMSGIPKELIECAKMEGCNELQIYAKIVVPISKPVFATAAIFFFTGKWNSLLWPMMLTSTKEMRTLPVGISTLQGQFQTHYGIMMAGAVVTAVPIITMFLILQKYFVKGITLGGVKE